jgi:hypothetical protein
VTSVRETGYESVKWGQLAQDRMLWQIFVNMVKVKVKLSLCLTKHHAMMAYWGVEV